LIDFILDSNLFLCNRGNVPTFTTKTYQTIIDSTLISDSLVHREKNGKIPVLYCLLNFHISPFTYQIDTSSYQYDTDSYQHF